jgi:hypothetical protein
LQPLVFGRKIGLISFAEIAVAIRLKRRKLAILRMAAGGLLRAAGKPIGGQAKTSDRIRNLAQRADQYRCATLFPQVVDDRPLKCWILFAIWSRR